MTLTENDVPADSSDGLRRAVRLLILLSRIDFTPAQKELAKEEVQSFSAWKLFSSLAVRHGVAALVWQNITDLGLAGSVPETEKTLMEGLRFKSIARVSWITEAAAGVTSLLEQEGIRVVLLKGLALEQTVYGSRGLRQMSDADLLVAPSDALKARDILVRNGFRSMPLKSSLYRHIILDLGNHLPELHRGGISVDLHYRLFGPEGEEMVVKAIEESEIINRIPAESKWVGKSAEGSGKASKPAEGSGMASKSAEVSGKVSNSAEGSGMVSSVAEVSGSGKDSGKTSVFPGSGSSFFRVLPPLTSFLALVSHIYKHEIKGEFQLRLWTDIYLLLERYGERIMVPGLPAAAEKAGIAAETRIVLTVMEQVWGVVIPETMRAQSGEEQAKADRFLTDLAHPGAVESISQREMFKRNLYGLRCTRKKMIFIIGDVFPSLGFMRKRYGCRSSLFAAFYYPHRLGKLFWILGLLRAANRED